MDRERKYSGVRINCITNLKQVVVQYVGSLWKQLIIFLHIYPERIQDFP